MHFNYVFFIYYFGVRPTKAMSWWEDSYIVGGRDEIGGGTWLACSEMEEWLFSPMFWSFVLSLRLKPEEIYLHRFLRYIYIEFNLSLLKFFYIIIFILRNFSLFAERICIKPKRRGWLLQWIQLDCGWYFLQINDLHRQHTERTANQWLWFLLVCMFFQMPNWLSLA